MLKTAADHAAHGLADLCLYHWSPRSRRGQIQRRGLVPGSHSVAREWRPPYICFSDDALLAWNLSGRIHTEIAEWDLWMCFYQDVDRWEIILDTYIEWPLRHYVKEYRVYHRIFKRHVHWIASRTSSGR